LFSDNYHHPAHFSFTSKELRVSLSGSLGAANEVVGCASSTAGEILLSPTPLLEAIKRMSGDRVTLEFRGMGTPIVIREEEYLVLIMPHRREDAQGVG
jgi:DNA polymerase III sliding clamp (beta) subunit (PCNA family)